MIHLSKPDSQEIHLVHNPFTHLCTYMHTCMHDLLTLVGQLHTPTTPTHHTRHTLTLGVDRLQQLVYTYSKTAMKMMGFTSERTRGEPSATDESANIARNTSQLQ